MRTIDIEEVRKNLEELIDDLKPGQRFAISVDGTPRVQVVALGDGERLSEDGDRCGPLDCG
jgi:antitoxin (DNA-binding transcriptional repressor) of toxin-antitoxin stability system